MMLFLPARAECRWDGRGRRTIEALRSTVNEEHIFSNEILSNAMKIKN
jgi:hypothetical protein